ncbi:MAG: TonB-dependent receptor [Deltaproteobacteria bacterium]|jgi:iron complex outermembrane receptor protein|nr:TonB-dependent receptor [Deltaproteobacteria bacterium]
MSGNYLTRSITAAMAFAMASAALALPALGQQEAPARQTDVLSTMIVESTKEGALTRDTAPAGFLGDRSPMELPFVSSSITEYAIREFSAPGGDTSETASVLTLNPSIRDSVSMFSEMYIRGFRFTGYDIGINGLGGMFGPLYVPSYAFESIDVLEGPSIAYMGTTTVYAGTGGHVNYRTKVARPEPQFDLTLSFFGRSGLTEQVDFGRRFGANKEWGIRATVERTSGETAIRNAKNDRLNIMVNIDRKTADMRTNLAIGHFRYGNTGNYGGRNFFLNDAVTRLPAAPKTSDAFGPDWNETNQRLTLVTLNHEQRIRDWLVPFLDFGYSREESDPRILTSRITLMNNAGDYFARVRDERLKRETMTVQGGVRGTVRFGSAENSYLAAYGYTYHERGESGTWPYTDFAPYGNIFTGARPDYSIPANVSTYLRKTYSRASTGFTLMDTLSLFNKKLSLFGGFHWHDNIVKNYNASGAVTQEVKSSNISPTFGIVWRPLENLTFYASHTESFSAGTRVSANYVNVGEVLAPAKTKQNEIGAKYQWEQLLFTLALFDIRQSATRSHDVPGGRRLQADGELRNRGAELAVSGSLFDRLDVIGGVMYIDARQEKTERGLYDGLRTNGVANWSGTLAATYRITDGLKAMGRLYYMGSASLMNERFRTPAFATLDLGLSYTHEIRDVPVTLAVKCFNVLDNAYWKPYQHPDTGTNAIVLGNPRTFQVSLGVKF